MRKHVTRANESVRAEIRLQLFRNRHRPIRSLIRLDQRREQSRQRQPRTVERVAEPVFLRVLEPQIHPARLEILEVRAARHFQIRVLPRRPHFDIVGLRRAETEIARAQLDDAVMQAE